MSNISQKNHQMSISDFGLGTDVFLLSLFSGSEYISDLFEFEIIVLSEDLDVSPEDIIGHYATVKIETKTTRFFHGLIKDFSFGEVVSTHGLREYRLTMVPWLWLLTKTNNYRVFQEKNCAEIVTDIFNQAGFNDFEWKSGEGQIREYCIQHNESDFDFVSRLLEEEGIAYHFLHANDKHTLVFTDQANPFEACEEFDVEYFPGSKDDIHISKWESQHTLKKGVWSLNDYDFKMPNKKLIESTTAINPFHSSKFLEHYEYPAFYNTNASSDLTKSRIESEESLKHISLASSKCVSFYAGGRFNFSYEKLKEQSGEYVIRQIKHLAYDMTYLTKQHLKNDLLKTALGEGVYDKNNSDDKVLGSDYLNNFHCIPVNVYFRPGQKHRRPTMKGPQSAVVVGPKGEEIYTDEYGRIKVQFIWDREGSFNENSSCFLRVMQVWAGNKWGASFVPRIGHEVIVDFLDGDPDRPIVSGTVYNGKNSPPYTSKTQSGIKSRSTKGASQSNFNELRFDDKLGAEEVYIQAEKDQNNLVKNNETTNVGNNRTEDVGVDETITIGNDRTEKVGNNENISIGQNRTENVGKNENIAIGKNRTEKVGNNENISIGKNRSENVGASEAVTIKMLRTHNVGINDMLNVGAAQEVSVGGFRMLNVGLYQNRNTGLDLTEKIGKKFVIDAGDEITIKTGEASINMKSDGSITFAGTTIKNLCDCEFQVTAKNNVTLKGKKILEN